MAIKQSPSAAICADEDKIARVVLFPGDPLRARALAESYLDGPELFNSVRNMLGYTGLYKGKRVSVMGSGMGVPSATLYAHELYNYFGVETIIRIGTAGGLSENIKLRDIILAMAASTNSNFASQYRFPGTLSPCADYPLLHCASTAAQALHICPVVGQVYTADMYYSADSQTEDLCRRLGILAVDMETAGLYWEAMSSRRRALSVLSVSNLIPSGDSLSAEARQTSFNAMMQLALETAWSFA